MKSLFTGSSHRGALALAGVAVALVLAAFAASASAAAFTAHLSAPNHQPRANKKFWITVTATRGRQQLSGSVNYAFLYHGIVVSRQAGVSFKNGVCHDFLLFPERAVGYTLTLQVNVTTKFGTVSLPWWIKTRP